MFSSSRRLLAGIAAYCALTALAQPPTSRLNPLISKVVDEVSEESIAAIMKKLESFGTRYVRPLSVGMLCFAVSLSMTVVAVFAPLIQVVEALGRSASC